jgi:3-polyprenyl-4-hydroxybenzoate decarboxylase
MDDISEEDHAAAQASGGNAAAEVTIGSTQAHTLNTVSSGDQGELFEREARIKINYRRLAAEHAEVEGGAEGVC